MARGTSIVVSDNPRGVFKEGYLNASLFPGTVCQIDVSEGIGDDGNFDYEAYAPGADGNQRPLFILLPDVNRGMLETGSYVTGDRAFFYVPAAGEELNMLVLNLAGTGDDHSFGDVLMVDNTTGKLIATSGTPESEPFILLEDITDPTADTLAHVLYTGY